MGAPDVLHLLEISGLSVSLRGENIVITPAERITPDIRRLILENKPGLLASLKNETTSFRWLVHFTDRREPMEVFTHPDADFDRMMREYPDAVAAEQLPEPPRPVMDCTTCTNSRRPGGVARYCSARPELPPAYGDGHPLRLLPDGGGAECGQWQERQGLGKVPAKGASEGAGCGRIIGIVD